MGGACGGGDFVGGVVRYYIQGDNVRDYGDLYRDDWCMRFMIIHRKFRVPWNTTLLRYFGRKGPLPGVSGCCVQRKSLKFDEIKVCTCQREEVGARILRRIFEFLVSVDLFIKSYQYLVCWEVDGVMKKAQEKIEKYHITWASTCSVIVRSHGILPYL